MQASAGKSRAGPPKNTEGDTGGSTQDWMGGCTWVHVDIFIYSSKSASHMTFSLHMRIYKVCIIHECACIWSCFFFENLHL